MAHVKKSSLVVWKFKVSGKAVYVTTDEKWDVGYAMAVLRCARIGDVFNVDGGELIKTLDAVPAIDTYVQVCEGGKSQYVYEPTVHTVVEAYVKRQQKAEEAKDEAKTCDGKVVDIDGKKYKLTLVK